jgi:hypothetical protein
MLGVDEHIQRPSKTGAQNPASTGMVDLTTDEEGNRLFGSQRGVPSCSVGTGFGCAEQDADAVVGEGAEALGERRTFSMSIPGFVAAVVDAAWAGFGGVEAGQDVGRLGS